VEEDWDSEKADERLKGRLETEESMRDDRWGFGLPDLVVIDDRDRKWPKPRGELVALEGVDDDGADECGCVQPAMLMKLFQARRALVTVLAMVLMACGKRGVGSRNGRMGMLLSSPDPT
jgi:hypothetical protein